MKKNLGLLGLLVVLLVGTYIFHEKKLEKAFFDSFTKDRLIAQNEIKKLVFMGILAQKNDGQWSAGEMLLSHNKMKVIELKISQIQKLKDIEGDESNYFNHKLPFEVNDEKWVLGDMTLDKQGFYISRNGKIMIATIEGENAELTDDPKKLSQIKYDELRAGLTSEIAELFENQLFRYYPKLPLATVTIETDGRQAYELDLKDNKTLPPSIEGILVHDRLAEKFQALLTQVTIKKEVPFHENLKFSKVGQMSFADGERKVKWELWLKGDNSADSYIIDNEKKKAFLMVGGTLKVFFIQVQDYWDKKVIPPSEFENFTRLSATFIQGEKTAKVSILNREPLAFETKGFKIDDVKMNILLQYVFNLSEKDQADRVSPLSKSERKEVLSGQHLRLEIMGQELLFWRKQQELIVVNLTQGYKAHFLIADESFRATFEDVLK
jgi:hypothetical protein